MIGSVASIEVEVCIGRAKGRSERITATVTPRCMMLPTWPGCARGPVGLVALNDLLHAWRHINAGREVTDRGVAYNLSMFPTEKQHERTVGRGLVRAASDTNWWSSRRCGWPSSLSFSPETRLRAEDPVVHSRIDGVNLSLGRSIPTTEMAREAGELRMASRHTGKSTRSFSSCSAAHASRTL